MTAHDDAARLREIAETQWPSSAHPDKTFLRSIAARLEAAPAVRVPEDIREAAEEHWKMHTPKGAVPCECWGCIMSGWITSLQKDD